jgi:membrane-associated phospholipid phosphatase
LHAKSFVESSGDALLVLLPLSSYGFAFYENDSHANIELTKSLALTSAITFGLKKSINKERPDKSDNESFPSAHTSITFSSAAFLHKRYGLKYATLHYILATYTGYTRVKSDKHDMADVVFGAVIGMISSYIFTTKRVLLKTNFTKKEKYFYLSYKF